MNTEIGERSMNYKLDSIIEKIKAPVICVIDGQESEYADGAALYGQEFSKYYLIESLSVREEKIVVTFKENKREQGGPINWVGEEAIF